MHDNPFEAPAADSGLTTSGLAPVGALLTESIALIRSAPTIFSVVLGGQLGLLVWRHLMGAPDLQSGLGVAQLLYSVASFIGFTAVYAVALAALEPPPREAVLRGLLSRLPRGLVCTFAYFLICYVGMLLLLIPGVLWMVRYVFCVSLVLEGRTDVGSSFRRSEALVRGRWWGVFGRMMVGILPSLLATVASLVLMRSTGELRSPLALQVLLTLLGVWQIAYFVALYRSARQTA